MKNLNFKNLVISVSMLALFGISSSCFSQAKAYKTTDKKVVKLEYNYPEGKTFKYVTDSKIVQDMDVNGQSMLVNVSMYMGCKVKAAGKLNGNLVLEITIDSMAQNIESPQGSAGGPIMDVSGKAFNMVISPAGKTIDLTEASKIVYTVEGSAENTLTQAFLNYFPVLPKNGVNPGDTWTTTDTIDSKTSTNTMWMPVESNFKFEGIENVEGIDCARITAVLSGSRKMITQAQGMEIHTSGPYTGTQILFFAVKDGYLVKETITTKMTGTIEIPDQNLSFPVVMNVTATNQIVK